MPTTYKQAQQSLKKVREKYPQYSDMQDQELATRLADKYPEYKDISTAIQQGPQTAQQQKQQATQGPRPETETGQALLQGAEITPGPEGRPQVEQQGKRVGSLFESEKDVQETKQRVEKMLSPEAMKRRREAEQYASDVLAGERIPDEAIEAEKERARLEMKRAVIEAPMAAKKKEQALKLVEAGQEDAAGTLLKQGMEEDAARLAGKEMGEDIDANLPPFLDAAVGGAAGRMQSLAGALGRAAGAEDYANFATKASQGLQAASADNPAERTIQSAVGSLTTLAAGGGGIGSIGAFTLQAMNRAAQEAEEAGMTGIDRGAYVLGQGAAEAVISTAFQAAGLGGLERTATRAAGQAMRNTLKDTLKRFGVQTLSELSEETLVELAQRTQSYAQGLDPDAFDPDRMAEDFGRILTSTIMTMGLGEGGRRVGRQITGRDQLQDRAQQQTEDAQDPGVTMESEERPARILEDPDTVYARKAAEIEDQAAQERAEAERQQPGPEPFQVTPEGQAARPAQIAEQEQRGQEYAQQLRETAEQQPKALPEAATGERRQRFTATAEGGAIDEQARQGPQQRPNQVTEDRRALEQTVMPHLAAEQAVELEPSRYATFQQQIGNQTIFEGRADAEAYLNDLKTRNPNIEADVASTLGGAAYAVQTRTPVDQIAETFAETASTTQRRRMAQEAGITDLSQASNSEVVRAMLETGMMTNAVQQIVNPEPAAPTLQEVRSPGKERRGAAPRGRQEVAQLQQEGDLEAANRRIRELQAELRTDELTGIGNQRAWNEGRVDLEQRAQRTGRGQALVWFDWANLKTGNDVLGHGGMDTEMKRFAGILHDVAQRYGGTATRQGGDEFGLILPGKGQRKAKQIMQEVEQQFGTQQIAPGVSLFATGGVGIVNRTTSAEEATSQAETQSENRKAQIKQDLGEATDRPGAQAAAKAAAEQEAQADHYTGIEEQPAPAQPAEQDTARRQQLRAIEQRRRRRKGELQFQRLKGRTFANIYDYSTAAFPAEIKAVSKREHSKFRQAVGKAGTPVSTVVKHISPRLYGRLKAYERQVSTRRHDLIKSLDVAHRNLRSAIGRNAAHEALVQASVHGNAGGRQYIRQNFSGRARREALAAFTERQKIRNAVYESAKEAGAIDGFIKDHFPRQVKNYKEWVEYKYGQEPDGLRQLYREKAEQEGRPLFDYEKAVLANQWFAGHQPKGNIKLKTPTVGQRTETDLTVEEFRQFYKDPVEAEQAYVTDLVELTERAKLFGGKRTEESMKDSVGRIIEDERMGTKDLPAWQKEKLRDILASRFTTGEQAPSAILRWHRDLGYFSLLADPAAAAIQFGDLALVVGRDGARATFPSIPLAAFEKVLTAENMGLDRISAEMHNASGFMKFLDKSMQMTGFKDVDKAMKTVNLVSAYRKARRIARNPNSKEFKQWRQRVEPALGEQHFQALIDGLRNNQKNEAVLDYVWMELSRTQPTDLMEMPQWYLQSPNGRIFYMMKSFTVKQLDLIREESLNDIAIGARQGDIPRASKGIGKLARLMMLLAGSYASVDWIRDWVLGKRTDFSDSLFNGMLGLAGLHSFLIGQAAEEGLGTAAYDAILPPARFLNDASQDAANTFEMLSQGPENFDPRELKLYRNFPIGDMIFWRWGKGAEWQQKFGRQETLEDAANAYNQGDNTAVQAILKDWNGWANRKNRIGMDAVSQSAKQRRETE